MRRFLPAIAGALLVAAASVSAADSEGAETLAPTAPKVVPAGPSLEPRQPAPVVVPPMAADTAIRTDSVAVREPAATVGSPADSAPGTAATPGSAVPRIPVAAPFVIRERADTTRKEQVHVRTIAIGMDTTGVSRGHRSTWMAVGLTLVLPGAGHRYLGHNTGAAVWMTTDLLLWSGLAVAWQMGDLYVQDAAEIANRHAGASLGSDPDIDLLETMRDWRSRRPVAGRRDSYDEALLQQGLATDSRFPEDAAHDWDWGSPENPENNRHIAQFEDALKGYRTARIAVTYAAGGLLVSRAIAVADILRIRRKSASRAGIHAVVVPRLDGAQGLVAYQF